MWPNPDQFPADLITFTEEILNGKLHFSCSEARDLRIILEVYGTLHTYGAYLD